MSDELPERVDESEFLDMSGDPAQARLLRKSLEQIARGGAGEALTEMARDVLSGRIGLRAAMDVSAYSEPAIEQAQAFKAEQWDALSQRERDDLVTEGEKLVEEQRRELAEERRQAQQQKATASPGARHQGGNWSLY
ncbi:hypothetical protein AB0C96_20850 [Streptomyces sp. NPDC048506]|uniref:hypothetical protein n=1 Tax=Streptomyces sp. NPDC048506 TaxID=3155028 RepID=UPI00343B1631